MRPALIKASSIAFSLAVLVGYACHAYESRSYEIERAEASLLSVTRALEHHAKWSLAAADVLLRRNAAQGMEFLTATEGRDELHRVLAERAMASPTVWNFMIINARGQIAADSFSFPPRQLDSSAESYFIVHQGEANDQLYITPAFKGRLSGKMLIGMSRQIRDEQGQFAGVAFATIDAGYFRSLYEGLNLGFDATTTLLTTRGDILMRHPYSREVMGLNTADTPLFNEHLPNAPEGSYHVTSIFDHSNRIVAYKKLTDLPLVVTASYSIHKALERWYRNMAIEGLLVLALASCFVFGGAVVTKERKLRLQAEEQARQALAKLERRA